MTSPCRNGATCRNTNGSYQCLCAKGYEGRDCIINTDDCASCKFINCNAIINCNIKNVYTININFFIYSPMSERRYLSGRHRRLHLPLCGRFQRQTLRNRRGRVSFSAVSERRRLQGIRELVYMPMSARILRYKLPDERRGLHGQQLHERRQVHRRYQQLYLRL